jgi:hypothetical protein
MSLEDKNIDQLFRDAAANSKAPEYDSEYWDEVSAILDKEQPQKRMLMWWTFGGAAITTALLILLFVSNDTAFSEKRYTKSNAYEIKPEQVTINHDQPANSAISPHSVSTVHDSPTEVIPVMDEGNSTRSNGSDERNYISKSNTNLTEPSLLETNSVDLSKERAISETSIKARKAVNPEMLMSSLPVKVHELVCKVNTTHKLIDRSSPFRLIAQVDLGVMENYETARPLQSGLASLSIKAELEKSNLIFRSGVGLEISSNADLIVSKRAQFYSFGLSNIQTDLSYQNMLELFIPLEFGYHHYKTRFGIGLQANYLINTTMEMNVYEGNDLISSERFTGYNNGLNLLSGQGYLWVNHQFTSKLAVGAKIGTNLTKRFNDIAYFNESAATNPIFGQLSLNYTLFE